MTDLARRLILSLGTNRTVSRLASRHGLKFGAKRFVAGETLTTALEVTRALNDQGLAVTLDLLGESVTEPAVAREMGRACGQVLEAIAQQGLDANLSVKLTQLGLDISPDLALEIMERLQDVATACNSFIRIDMESSAVTDVTLDIFRKLYGRNQNVGTVVQAYLYRSQKDLADLAKLGANIRLVKGAYMEPPEVAYSDKAETDQAYTRLVAQHLIAGCYTAVASHDDKMIGYTERFVQEYQIPRSQFEFQMLYGIRSSRQLELALAGYRTRVYVPFGQDWYPYFVRRLAERPANLWFVAKNLFRS